MLEEASYLLPQILLPEKEQYRDSLKLYVYARQHHGNHNQALYIAESFLCAHKLQEQILLM